MIGSVNSYGQSFASTIQPNPASGQNRDVQERDTRGEQTQTSGQTAETQNTGNAAPQVQETGEENTPRANLASNSDARDLSDDGGNRPRGSLINVVV